ncbi:RNA polymerase sigma factor [Rhizosphaericola mali]|uniref:RNA polymerase sigma factor n=2 Tax=Rhizosphaericola mali TaxID=2545455 RepID=A0A5P2G9P1_9BACT|nr:RNA polymerase sigma factor [Rhizosphaericola mali]
MRFIRGKVPSIEDAEDVMQDVWMQLSRIANISEIESLSGWLYYVAKNKIADLYRKRQTENIENFSYENEDGALQIKEILLIDEIEFPEMKDFKDLFWKELMTALAELPANQKDVFILNEIDDKTLQEIANDKNENIKTIISRKGYAVKHIRKKLQYLYDELNS